MPAEWEKHDATWIAWPHQEPDWPGKLAPIPWVYAEIVRALSDYDRVEILCHDATIGDNASTLLLYYIYDIGFKYWDTAYAATLTVVLLALLATAALVQFLTLERRVHYQ